MKRKTAVITAVAVFALCSSGLASYFISSSDIDLFKKKDNSYAAVVDFEDNRKTTNASVVTSYIKQNTTSVTEAETTPPQVTDTAVTTTTAATTTVVPETTTVKTTTTEKTSETTAVPTTTTTAKKTTTTVSEKKTTPTEKTTVKTTATSKKTTTTKKKVTTTKTTAKNTTTAADGQLKGLAVKTDSADNVVYIKVGEQTKITPVFTPANANNKKVSWVSNRTDRATVDANGTVTGVSSGAAIIQCVAEDGGLTAACMVVVTD